MLNRRLVSLAAASVLLAACGQVHPGQAAVVDGVPISMKRVDTTARIYCRLLPGSASANGPIPYATVRRQAVSDLVFAVVARNLAAERHLDVAAAEFALTAHEIAIVRRRLHARQVSAAITVAEQNGRTYAIADRLGRKKGRSAEMAREAGLRIIARAASSRRVHVDPRFGVGVDSPSTLSVHDDAFQGSAATSATQVCQV